MYLLILFQSGRRTQSPLDLHPTMYLLIPSVTASFKSPQKIFTSHYVSINSDVLRASVLLVPQFTSHYVSINSKVHFCQYLSIFYLHPTMYLLIRARQNAPTGEIQIYIPLCIY